MVDPLAEQVSKLLKQAWDAHHIYRTEQLQSRSDQQWYAWYADYLLTNGLGGLLGSDPDPDALATFLDESNQQHKAEGGQQSWQDYTAAKLIETFS